MKKIIIFLIICGLSVFLLPQNKVKAATEYDGINYINPIDFSAVTYNVAGANGFAQLQTGYSTPIAIKPGVEYFLLPTYVNKEDLSSYGAYEWYDLPLFKEENIMQISLYEDGMDDEPVDTYIVTKKLFSDNRFVGYAMTFDQSIAKISFMPMVLSSSAMPVSVFSSFFATDVMSLDCALLMIEADRINELNAPSSFNYDSVKGSPSYDVTYLSLGEDLSVYQYGNTFINGLSPILSAEEYSVYTSVDEPITIAELRALINLRAYDEVDGNLTDAIIVSQMHGYDTFVLDISNVKDRQLGIYPIVFSVSDQAGNTAECTIQIVVVDNTRPVLQVAESVLSYTREVDSEALVMQTILDQITVTDNYSIVTYEIIDNGYVGNESILGTYEILIRYTDTSNNQTDVVVTITNVDNTSPEITYLALTYQISYTANESIAFILSQLEITAVDNYDGSITYSIISDDYTVNKANVGTYAVVIRAIDSSNNATEKEILITIIDDVAPIFYFDKDMVVVQAGTPVSTEDIIDFLTAHQRLKENLVDVEIIQNTHVSNEDAVGQYQIKVKVTYENGETEEQVVFVKVVAPISEAPVKLSFLASVWQFILKIFLFIWHIIKWPIDQIIKLF